jgi:hypothetical protein
MSRTAAAALPYKEGLFGTKRLRSITEDDFGRTDSLNVDSMADLAFFRAELLGTADQWIKQGNYARKWTRLSCRRFLANAVRLQLFVLAYDWATS